MRRSTVTAIIVGLVVMLAAGCVSAPTTVGVTGSTVGPRVVARAGSEVSAGGNRSPEKGWWTWPPPSPLAEAPINSAFDLSGDVLFGRDRVDLSLSAASQLEGIVRLAQAHPTATIDITGYTDGDGSTAYNLDLSLRRASSVADWLAQAGVERARLQVVGRGEDDPLLPNDSVEHKAKNRRVVIQLASP